MSRILGHTLLTRGHRTFHRLQSPFDLVFDPRELHTRVYLPSLRSSDLSQALVSFDLAVDPHELSYWAISPPTEFACIVILVSSSFGPLDQIISVSVSEFLGVAPISIDHLPICLSSVRVGTTPISIDHHLVSWCLCFRGYTYIDRLFSYPFVFS